MTPFERAQLLLMLHVYLLGRRTREPDAFADQPSLTCINDGLWMAYWDVAAQRASEDIGADVGIAADFRDWLLTLWPTPPTA